MNIEQTHPFSIQLRGERRLAYVKISNNVTNEENNRTLIVRD